MNRTARGLYPPAPSQALLARGPFFGLSKIHADGQDDVVALGLRHQAPSCVDEVRVGEVVSDGLGCDDLALPPRRLVVRDDDRAFGRAPVLDGEHGLFRHDPVSYEVPKEVAANGNGEPPADY